MGSKGVIRNISEAPARTGVPGHVHMAGYKLLDPGPEGSMCLGVGVDVLEPNGGSIDPHNHADKAVFDHAFYVASGRVLAKVGDGEEKVIGPGTLVYCPSHVTHSFRNIGKTAARIVTISAHPTKQ